MLGIFGAVEFAFYIFLTYTLGNNDLDDSSVKMYFSRPGAPNRVEIDRKTPPTIYSGEKVYFLVHGFTQNTNQEIYTNITKHLVGKGFVVFNIDWSLLAAGPNYFAATANTIKAANVISNYIKDHNIDPSKIRLVGLSLGAHICGFVGKVLKIRGVLVSSIMGLDPAGPLFGFFEPVPSWFRLDENDASSVITLQTNAGNLGTRFPLGKVNFQANGGSHQPGCHDDDATCCHERAIVYYYYSLLSNKFIGVDANNNTLCYGFHIPSEARGVYTFYTSDHPPYSLN